MNMDKEDALATLQKERAARTAAEEQLRRAEIELAQLRLEKSKTARESERKYRNLVEDIHDLIAHFNPKGGLTFINRATQRVFGLGPHDYNGVPVLSFIEPADRRKVVRWWRHCMVETNEPTFIELRHVNKSTGQIYDLQWSAALQYSATGKLIGVGIVGRDVTETRKAEREYRNLFTEMLDGFALHEIICQDGKPVDYRFLSVNPAFENITGLKSSEVVGKLASEVLPNLEKFWIETYGKVALTGEPAKFQQYTAELDKYFQITAYSPTPLQFACIFQDVTPRKRAEQEKVLLETQLRQRHKMEAIGTLAGGIAHDFNNILTAILGYTDMAQSEIPAWHSASSKIQEVIKAGTRAKELVKQILAFSRKEELQFAPLDLYSLTTEAIVFLRASIPTTIDILLDLDPNCGSMHGNATQIHQVLMNICTNAAQAMEKDGGTLTISLRRVTSIPGHHAIDSRMVQGPFLCLAISDTGGGIPEDCLDRIFDPYFTTKEIGKGSGMGLAVVHGIMKSHDGVIKVKSDPGYGTTFSLYFPRVDPTVDVSRAEEQAIELDLGSGNILVVDDDTSIVKMLTIVLQKAGYTVQAVNSSQKALELFQADPMAFDLLLTDMTMPEMTGDKLALSIRKLSPTIPIILCTGYSSQIDETKAMEQGLQAYLQKPIEMQDLLKTVHRLLDQR